MTQDPGTYFKNIERKNYKTQIRNRRLIRNDTKNSGTCSRNATKNYKNDTRPQEKHASKKNSKNKKRKPETYQNQCHTRNVPQIRKPETS